MAERFPKIDRAMTAAAGRRWLERFCREQPVLVAEPVRPGHRRGVGCYRPEDLPFVVGMGIATFRGAHGRPPDPGLARMADRFFALKFFQQLPEPNPADKLNAGLYLAGGAEGQARVLARPWVSDRPELPPDAAVPPGRYYLKLALGNATNERVVWPPSAEERARLEALAASWFRWRYGVIWGEWWYGIGPQRLFLEEDITEARAGKPEFKFFVRDGRVAAIRAIRHEDFKLKNHRECFWDAAWRRLEGRTVGYGPLEAEPPAAAERMVRAAEHIGRRFDLIRVDFMDDGGERPILNEITVGDQNARRRVEPEALERILNDALFG